MRLLIDNGDGLGAMDYTPALVATGPLVIRRERGHWTRCSALLDVAGVGVRVPAPHGRVQVRSDAGLVLFAGYVMRVPVAAAALQEGAAEVALVEMEAAEDAWLLGMTPPVFLQSAGAVTHAVRLEENAVRLVKPAASELELLASDVTVSGGREATTYVTELFAGDGTTAAFGLMESPFRETLHAVLLRDGFDAGQIHAQSWRLLDTGQHLGLGSGGLQVSGGNGLDGQTVMAAVSPVELAGTVTATLSEVMLQPGSDGVVLGMYSNVVTIPNCVAGFRVKGSAGATTIVALVQGAEVGTAYTFAAGHRYTLRLRLHCTEMQRVLERYEAVVNGNVAAFGGGLVDAPVSVVLEVQDLGLASSAVASVLYAGRLASSPAVCVFGLVNSVSLQMQAGGCTLKQGGSAWVVSTLADGSVVTRREGAVDEGADFALGTSLSGGKVRFYPGRVPAAGETVTVLYRRAERAVARVQNAAALAAAQLLAVPGLPNWAGAVERPVPRSAADCLSAAQALLAFGAGAGTGVSGECTMVNPQQVADVAVGDLLALPGIAGSGPVTLPVERVTVTDEHGLPEVLRYAVGFGQRKANGLSFGTKHGLPADVMMPVALSVPGSVPNLAALQVVSATAAALQVDAGMAAPNGGGFEVRRRDGGWGAGDGDLVLRSPVRGFSVPRQQFQERFYVRMYDGSLPPVYSWRSSVMVTHLPVG